MSYANVEVNGVEVEKADDAVQISFEENGYEVTVEMNLAGLRNHLEQIEERDAQYINERGASFIGHELQELGSVGVSAEPTDEKWEELAAMVGGDDE